MATNTGIEVNPTINLHGTVNMGSAASESNAEAWAVGERKGVPVNETDQTYHNNSKYYAQEAGDEAEDAEAWAKGTRGGEPVGSGDPAYHNNTAYYHEMSQEDANAAAASMSGAQAAARQAQGHAGAAAQARDEAKAWAHEAEETVVAAQGPGILYVDTEGIPYVLE